MITKDPKKRISAEDALKKDWFFIKTKKRSDFEEY